VKRENLDHLAKMDYPVIKDCKVSRCVLFDRIVLTIYCVHLIIYI